MCAVCMTCSSMLGIVFPLIIVCALAYFCALKSGAVCASVALVAANCISFAFCGVTAEFLFGALLFSPFVIIVFVTAKLKGKLAILRAIIFAAHAAIAYTLLVTVFAATIGSVDGFTTIGLLGFGAVWTLAFAAFGFVFERAMLAVSRRFKL